MTINREKQPLTEKLKAGLAPPLYFVAILILAYVVLFVFPETVRFRMGILPRSFGGLPGVFLHPFWHLSARHLFCNALAIVILGWFISLRSRKMLLIVTAASWLGGGVMLWMVGRPLTVVGGASSIVYGYLGFILLHGIFERSLVSIALSLVALLFFHDSLFGLLSLQTYPAMEVALPSSIYVSWEGHLCGFLAGAVCAFFTARREKEQKPKPVKKETPREQAEKILFSDEEVVDPREKIIDRELAAIKRKVGK